MLGRYLLTAVDFITIVSLGLLSSISIVLAIRLFPLLSWKFFLACSSIFIFVQAIFLALEHIMVEMAYKRADLVITDPSDPAPNQSAAISVPLCLTGIWQVALGICVLGSLADPLFSADRIGKPISILIQVVAILVSVTGGIKFFASLLTNHLVYGSSSTVDDARTLVESEADNKFYQNNMEKQIGDDSRINKEAESQQPFYHSFEERSRYLSLLTKLYKAEKERD